MQHLDQKELAARWRVSPRTLERWRLRGSGPSYLKLGGRCIYSIAEVERFEQQRLRERTGDWAAGESGKAEGESNGRG